MTIGVGLNVSNSSPSTCLNDRLTETFSPEEILNAYLTNFSELVGNRNTNQIIEEYMANWYHMNGWVTCHKDGKRAKLVGIGQSGEIIA
jgi:biotin-(acetyl-CoA carboxylase) ligase